MQTIMNRTAARRALGYAAALGVFWVLAAAIRPATTYHLAPILVAATLPLVLVSEAPDSAVRRVITAAVAGAALAVAVPAVLIVTDWLRGPSLLPFGGAATESVTFALGGGAAGLVIGLLRRRN